MIYLVCLEKPSVIIIIRIIIFIIEIFIESLQSIMWVLFNVYFRLKNKILSNLFQNLERHLSCYQHLEILDETTKNMREKRAWEPGCLEASADLKTPPTRRATIATTTTKNKHLNIWFSQYQGNGRQNPGPSQVEVLK